MAAGDSKAFHSLTIASAAHLQPLKAPQKARSSHWRRRAEDHVPSTKVLPTSSFAANDIPGEEMLNTQDPRHLYSSHSGIESSSSQKNSIMKSFICKASSSSGLSNVQRGKVEKLVPQHLKPLSEMKIRGTEWHGLLHAPISQDLWSKSAVKSAVKSHSFSARSKLQDGCQPQPGLRRSGSRRRCTQATLRGA